MPYYRRVGQVPRKRHMRVAHPDGKGFLHEELMGAEGFSQESSILYHLHSPSALLSVDTMERGASRVQQHSDATDWTSDHPLQPRHLRTSEVLVGGDVSLARTPLLANPDVEISWVAATDDGPLYRNAMGDELVYVQGGTACLETSFGSLDVRDGDYVLIPTSTTHRWVVTGTEPLQALIVASRRGHITIPAKHLSDRGQLLEGAPYSERDLRPPCDPRIEDDGETEVVVRNRGGLSSLLHAHHPFDVVGWDGCLYPFAFSIEDFEPIVGAVHQPPPVHQTFTGRGFVVCSFVPRPIDFGAEQAKIPYHHANIDSDEVLFYSRGDFMSRVGSGVGVGSITYHPAGFIHGPQPGSLERAIPATDTKEYAVMIDTFSPLQVSPAARDISVGGYLRSWAR